MESVLLEREIGIGGISIAGRSACHVEITFNLVYGVYIRDLNNFISR